LQRDSGRSKKSITAHRLEGSEAGLKEEKKEKKSSVTRKGRDKFGVNQNRSREERWRGRKGQEQHAIEYAE